MSDQTHDNHSDWVIYINRRTLRFIGFLLMGFGFGLWVANNFDHFLLEWGLLLLGWMALLVIYSIMNKLEA